MVSKLGLLWTNHISLFSLSFFLSVEMVIHHTHPEPLLCAGYTLGVLFVTVNAALPFSQLWAVSPLGLMHLQTLRTVGGLWRTELQVCSPGEAFSIPLPAPFLDPVGENPALRVFSAPLIFYKHALSMNCGPGFGLGVLVVTFARCKHCLGRVLGGDGHKNKSLY